MTIADGQASTTPSTVPFAGIAIDSHREADDAVGGAFLSRVLDGSEPFTASLEASQAITLEQLLPPDAFVVRRHTGRNHTIAFAESPDGSMLIRIGRNRADVTVAATSTAACEALSARVRSRIPQEDAVEQTRLRTWLHSSHGPASMGQVIDTPTWSEIGRNYPPRVRAQLADLMAMSAPAEGGRLVLWHGPPGTGKTTAIRALAREWRDWCDVDYIADPERLFGTPEYLFEVFLGDRHPPFLPDEERLPRSERWRVIVAEDSDEYLRSDVRAAKNGALGRILNLTDGILGQGSRTLVLLTTNEDVGQLDPALVRPGRCLSRLAFETFTPDEAREWLPEGSRGPDRPTTLAELYGLGGEFL